MRQSRPCAPRAPIITSSDGAPWCHDQRGNIRGQVPTAEPELPGPDPRLMNPGARFEVTGKDGFAFLTDGATADPRIYVEPRTLTQGPPPLTIQQAPDGSRFPFAGDRMLGQAATPGAPPDAKLETRRIDGWDVLVDRRTAKILDRRYVAEDETLGPVPRLLGTTTDSREAIRRQFGF